MRARTRFFLAAIVVIFAFRSALAQTTLTMVTNAPGAFSNAIQEIADEFMKEHPDIRVEVIGIAHGGGWAGYFEAISVRIAGGSKIDIIRVPTEGQRLFDSAGMMIPLDRYLQSDEMAAFLDDVPPALLESLRYNGELYWLPFEFNTVVMHYNTSLVDEAGAAYPHDGWTRHDMLELARKITADTNGDGIVDRYGVEVRPEGFAGYVQWIRAAGGDILDESWTRSRLNEPATLEGLQYMRDLIWEHQVAPRIDDLGNYLFGNDRLGMYARGRWEVPGLLASGFTHFDIQHFPLWEADAPLYGHFGMGANGILRDSENPDAAWEFLKYLSSAESLMKFLQAVPTGLPPLRSLWPALAETPPNNWQAFFKALPNAVPVYSPPSYPDIQRIMDQAVLEALNDQAPVRALVERAHRQIEAVLSGE